jgi:hypothetical protein
MAFIILVRVCLPTAYLVTKLQQLIEICLINKAMHCWWWLSLSPLHSQAAHPSHMRLRRSTLVAAASSAAISALVPLLLLLLLLQAGPSVLLPLLLPPPLALR